MQAHVDELFYCVKSMIRWKSAQLIQRYKLNSHLD